MNQTQQSNNNQSGQYKVFLRGGFWLIVLGAAILSYVVYRYSRVFPDLESRYTFIGQNVLNVLIFAAITVQALIYRRQWDAMQESLCESRETTKRDQRAYITTQQVTMHQFEIGKNVSAELVVVNNGKTPAKDVTIYAHLWLLKEPPDVSQAIAATPKGGATSKYVIGPLGGQAIHSFVATVLTQQSWAEIANTDQRYYMWGVVVYKDVFDRSHKTTFCMVHGGAHKKQFTFCDRGNEID